MKKQPPPAPKITDHDRLGLTFVLAAIFHGIVILGITFSIAPAAQNPQPPTLDVIIVQTQNPSKENKDAKYLAQVTQQGGGDSAEKVRPSDMFTAPTLAPDPGMALQTSTEQVASIDQLADVAVLHQAKSDFQVRSADKISDQDRLKPAQQRNQQQMQTARLAEEIDAMIEKQAQRPKVKFMNSSTKEFLPARYMRNWINRVERIGNLNYPDQAKRNRLSGTLILDVTIDSSGKLLKTELRRSSGHQVLDDAAKRIVKLAAPFPAFPEKLKQEADVIHITRSWEFLASNQIRSQ
jgi:periplasmic protein TonB